MSARAGATAIVVARALAISRTLQIDVHEMAVWWFITVYPRTEFRGAWALWVRR